MNHDCLITGRCLCGREKLEREGGRGGGGGGGEVKERERKRERERMSSEIHLLAAEEIFCKQSYSMLANAKNHIAVSLSAILIIDITACSIYIPFSVIAGRRSRSSEAKLERLC